jgi:hypothetical protein
MRSFAIPMLRSGAGMLVCTAKPDERSVWEGYCREAGRQDDLVVVSPGSGLCFNFLDYELKRPGIGAGLTENIVGVLANIMEVADRGSGKGGGRDDEGYWRRANRQLCRNAIDLVGIAKGRITIDDLYRAVISAPTSMEQLRSEEWRRGSACFRWLTEADKRPKTPRQQIDFGLIADYFLVEWPALSDKTRSVILSTFTSAADVLQRGVLRELFSGETTITPLAVEEGKVIVIDLPPLEFREVGGLAQSLWKYSFQRSIERRDVKASPRPAVLWCDEAQHVVTSQDMQFLTTCRAARVATVMISQNISNFYAALGGGDKGKAEADSLLANLNTKVFCANGDPVTNSWAADLIGRSRQNMANGSASYGDDIGSALGDFFGLAGAGQSSGGFSEVFEYEIQPREFSLLRTGGPANKGHVDTVVFQNGRVFKQTGRPWLPVTFRQQR